MHERSLHRNGPFVLLFLVHASQSAAQGFEQIVIDLLFVTVTTEPFLVSMNHAAGMIGGAVCAPLAGVLLDRVERRRAAAVGAASASLLCLALLPLVHTAQVGVASMFGFSFGFAFATTVVMMAAHTLLPRIVPADRIMSANAVQMSGGVAVETLTRVIGAMLFAATITGSVAVIAVCCALSAVAALRISRASVAPAPDATTEAGVAPHRAHRAGYRWLWRHEAFRTVAGVRACAHVVIGGIVGLLVLHATVVSGLSGIGYGVLLAVSQLGGLVGIVVARRTFERFGAFRVMVGTGSVLAAATIGLGLTSNGLVVALLLAIGAAAFMMSGLVGQSLLQIHTPDRLLGRVKGAFRSFEIPALPLGSLIGGVVATAFDVQGAYLALGIALALVTVLTFRGLRRLDELEPPRAVEGR